MSPFALALYALIFNFATAKLTTNYENSTFLDKANTDVKLSWKYDLSKDSLFIGLEVKAAGWVGFGFAHKIFQMQNYDVIIGKVQNGQGSLTDRHTTGWMEPLGDIQQDYNLTYSEEVNGTTTLEFHRKRLTGDSNDIDIKLGPMIVVYAYHSTADYPTPYKTKHDHSGYKTVVILPFDTVLPSNVTSSQPLPSSTYTVSAGISTMQGSQVVMVASASSSSSGASPSSLSKASRIHISPSPSSSRTTERASVTIPMTSSTVFGYVVPDYDLLIKVSLKAKVVNIEYEVIQDWEGQEYVKFKNTFEKNMAKKKKVVKVTITGIRKGSVIVDYDVFINSTSQQDAQQVIKNIQQEVTSGKMGNFTVDPSYPMGAVITMKVKPTSESLKAKPTKEDKYLVIIIILGVVLGFLFIITIAIIILLIGYKRKNHSSNSFNLITIGYSNHDVDKQNGVALKDK